MPSQKASQTIPTAFRFILTNVESLFAFLGALTILVKPTQYVSALTRSSPSMLANVGPDFVYTQLAGGWMYIVFSEAVILRFVDDTRVWRFVCAGILCSDALYSHSIAQAVGGWSEWLKIGHWTSEDWVVTATTFPFVLIRVAIVLGIGMKKSAIKQQ